MIEKDCTDTSFQTTWHTLELLEYHSIHTCFCKEYLINTEIFEFLSNYISFSYLGYYRYAKCHLKWNENDFWWYRLFLLKCLKTVGATFTGLRRGQSQLCDGVKGGLWIIRGQRRSFWKAKAGSYLSDQGRCARKEK